DRGTRSLDRLRQRQRAGPRHPPDDRGVGARRGAAHSRVRRGGRLARGSRGCARRRVRAGDDRAGLAARRRAPRGGGRRLRARRGHARRRALLLPGGPMTEPVVHVVHENPEWFGVFAEHLQAQGVPYREWLLTGGDVDLSQPAPPGVYWSRFSASSHTRGHESAKEHSRAVLAWAAASGRRVVNGASVLALEVSKVLQLTALQAAGIEVPRTRAVVGAEHLLEAAETFPAPFVTKHNQGGKGIGVRRYESAADLARELADGDHPEPVDGVTLQEYVAPADGTITRVEIVDGEVVYAIRGDTARGGF